MRSDPFKNDDAIRLDDVDDTAFDIRETVKRHEKVTPSEGGQAAKNDPFLRNGFTMAFMLNEGPVWDACCGNNWKDPSRAFCRRKGDQGDLPGPWDIAADGTQGDPVGTDVF
ncbi:hypothetical protein [Komagataeibacter intermedius]|uniref:hypothetical protein n=1 Tax=Komagataeibacter intermedius TaxID=66229 RepID=UPI002231E8F2|nr:hypothetical protein [Komagataeibacter intermedius]